MPARRTRQTKQRWPKPTAVGVEGKIEVNSKAMAWRLAVGVGRSGGRIRTGAAGAEERARWRLAVDVRLYPAAQQTTGRTGLARAATFDPPPKPRMPELPEVETTRRGIAPHVVGRRVVQLTVYDSAFAVAGSPRSRDIADRPHHRRTHAAQQVPAVSRGERHAARPSRNDRQPPRIPEPAAAPDARSRRRRVRRRHAASLSRPAPVRRDVVGDGTRRRASAARTSRSGAVRRRVRRRLLLSRDAHAKRGDQARADGQCPCDRCG